MREMPQQSPGHITKIVNIRYKVYNPAKNEITWCVYNSHQHINYNHTQWVHKLF